MTFARAIDRDDAQRCQDRLVRSLCEPACFGPDCRGVERLETHISYVLLDGRHAYKIKKAVALGFLDFTRLDDRRFFCEQELRLNRRTAPDIYLDVVPITGTIERPVIGGSGPPIEWALRMRQFPQQALLSHRLESGTLDDEDIDALAVSVAAFHAQAAQTPPDASFGSADDLLDLAIANLDALRPALEDASGRADLDGLTTWTRAEHAARRATFESRRDHGFVRECHGDLHLGNIALVDGAIVLFDCIEFSERLRWIDVMSEIAFTVMDLHSRGRPDLAQRFLNAYLETTGDYQGLDVLRFHLVYRALVRAKIAGLRASQAASDDALRDCREHVALARTFAQPPRPALVVTHGYSGCGKTTITQAILERLGAVRIRTDVERKRIFGLTSAARSGSGVSSGIYAPDVTQRLYDRVLALARVALDAGLVTIVDGAFLRRWQRDMFRQLAEERGVPFAIVAVHASDATLRERVAQRTRIGSDASEATLDVLDEQQAVAELPCEVEYPCVVTCDTGKSLDAATDDLTRALARRLGTGLAGTHA